MAKAVAAIVCAMTMFLLLGCSADGSNTDVSRMSQQGSTVSSSETALSIERQLAALDGVMSVNPIDVSGSQVYAQKYVVTFEQLLDHEDRSAGTFPQRVEVGIVDGAKCNVMETDGSLLLDHWVRADDAHELCSIAEGNYIHVEHRFFGASRPQDMSNDDVEYWQYMTSKNAADDYHRIHEELSRVLEGPWVATGTGRGGEVCAAYAYYHPSDMDLIMPYSGSFSDGLEDDRMYEFVYTGIGDQRYGAKKAKEYRDLVTSFQVELMRNKATLAPMLRQLCESQGSSYRTNVTDGMLFDMAVLEMAVREWQFNQESSTHQYLDVSFGSMRQILEKPEGSDAEVKEKQQAEVMFLYALSSPGDWAPTFICWPCYVGAVTEYGHYHYDFSYLREACRKAGIGDVLTVRPEEEDGLLRKVVLTPEQRRAFTYDGTLREGIAKWIDATDTRMVFVYGNSDPWYALRMHDTDNPNVRLFVSGEKAHDVRIADFDEMTQREISGVVREALFGS